MPDSTDHQHHAAGGIVHNHVLTGDPHDVPELVIPIHHRHVATAADIDDDRAARDNGYILPGSTYFSPLRKHLIPEYGIVAGNLTADDVFAHL